MCAMRVSAGFLGFGHRMGTLGLFLAACSLWTDVCPADPPHRQSGIVQGAVKLTAAELSLGPHHTRHLEVFGTYAQAAGKAVLAGVDAVQARVPDGGGYFVGRTFKPPESPVGYELRLFGHPLLKPPRTTSYCSGATYAAFIEALNLLFPDGDKRLSPERLEALRMQERDGRTREDFVKVWGTWNTDWGEELALVRLTGMGLREEASQALPGDFVNIAWKKGKGHAAVFLGWADKGGEPCMLIWSSQKHTRGIGDRVVPLSRIKEARFVRLSNPERVFSFESKS